MKRIQNMLLKTAAVVLVLAMQVTAARAGDACCDRGCDSSRCGSCLTQSCCDEPCCDCDPVCCDSSCDSACCGSGYCDYGGCLSDCFDSDCIRRLQCKLDRCGLIKRSDTCFDDFISPMINFVFFEDPRNVTEIRPIFVSQEIPSTIGSGVSAGGSAQLYALHLRAAVTDRLSLIAVKDGYIVDNTNGTLNTLLDDGWAAVSLGVKYNLIRDTCRGRLLSIGSTYELPIGSRRALQDIGDGEFHIFATAGQRLLNGNSHILSSFGYRLPVDDDVQTTSFHWSNHLDVRVTKRSYIFTEMAWWHWTRNASAGAPIGVAGQDLFNLSASNVKDNDLVTQNVGLKYKPRSNVEMGAAFEFPLTGFKDIIDNRVMLDLIFRY